MTKLQTSQDLPHSIGNTPLVHMNTVGKNFEILAKIESSNPLGSIKDRVAVSMIDVAEAEGKINANSTIIESTSGNTGIGLAFVCAKRGYKLILTMPETMSVERQKLLKYLGAELILTPGATGMNGAIAKAVELLEQTPDSWMPNQFENPANPAIHTKTTGPEIWEQTNGEIDFFVAGVGTGGTITGTGKYLKEKNSNIKIVAIEPANSPVLSGGQPGPHKIQGIGAGFIPPVLDRNILDEIVTIENDEAINTARQLAKQEGVLCGISSGAAMAGALKIANKPENKGKKIVVILPDTGERYLSTELMEE